MDRTLSDLVAGHSTVLPDPELCVFVDGQPTKDRVVWQTLVDVQEIRKAISKLKEINMFYRDIDDSAVDDSTKKTIEIVNTTTSKLLEKCSKQAYTIRRMDEKLPVGLDSNHYKMMTLQEPPLDSRWSFLDALSGMANIILMK